MALFLWTYINQKKALRVQNMNFEKLKEKVDRITQDAGSKDEPIIFYIGPGAKPESYAFYLQYGKKEEGKYQRFRMRIKRPRLC